MAWWWTCWRKNGLRSWGLGSTDAWLPSRSTSLSSWLLWSFGLVPMSMKALCMFSLSLSLSLSPIYPLIQPTCYQLPFTCTQSLDIFMENLLSSYISEDRPCRMSLCFERNLFRSDVRIALNCVLTIGSMTQTPIVNDTDSYSQWHRLL